MHQLTISADVINYYQLTLYTNYGRKEREAGKMMD